MIHYNTKREKIMLISLISTFLLASCKLRTSEATKFYAFQTINYGTLSLSERLTYINDEEFTHLYEAGWPLVFYVSAKHCKYVSDVEPHLYDYLATTNLLLFNFDVTSEAWNKIQSMYREELKFLGTPTFYFWQKGQSAHKITGTSTLATIELFTQTFSEIIDVSNTKVSFAFDTQIEDTSPNAQINLNFMNTLHLDVLLNTLLPALGNKRNLYVLNSDAANVTITLSNGTRYTYTENTNAAIIKAIKDYVDV